ncbi:hypothetical protein MAR_015697 [Mya arenaria]|uniref:Ubiquitin-like protease family profile domain-containing protein n=1 Tax=Mya arenaria TaxID=6604 RepID=A0ABY7FHQ7_MYAAR|nr:hypothetical protein MAR_015697 [Mya arenaria]
MVDYFESNMYETIQTKAGLENFDNYNPYSGITNNGAESINAKLKRLDEYKEREIDSIALYLNYLQGNDVSELLRAFCGESEWSLMNRFSYVKKDPETIQLPKYACPPEKMIGIIKGKLEVICKPKTQNVELSNEPTTLRTIEPDETNPVHNHDNSNKLDPKSQCSLAVKTIHEEGISLVPDMAVFVVRGSNQRKYNASLFPKEYCSCPSTSRCYHILAVMMAIGMSIPKDKKAYNLTQLRRNFRPKNNKKCGTKKGRKGDTDGETAINPAPDSALKKLIGESTPKSILQKTVRNTGNKRKLQFNDEQIEKIPKISETSFDDDMLELDISRDDETAVNILLKKQFGNSIHGLQLPEKVPVRLEKEGRWILKLPMDPVTSPATQIHHTHNDHWVSTILDNEHIYLLDSFVNERKDDLVIPDGLKIQLSQIYGRNKAEINVLIPDVMKENNSIDCGLYAIAFITSYCVHYVEETVAATFQSHWSGMEAEYNQSP